ncbi:hypothetical protein D3C72_1178030 [compost metagenome]
MFIGEEGGRGFNLAVEQADQVRRTGDAAQLPLGLQMPLQGGDGQAASAGAHQVDLAGTGDRPTDVHRLFHRLDIRRQAPFAMAYIRVAPTDHEGLQAVFQCVLDEAVVWAEVENVVLVDLRRHHQQRLGVLLFAHRSVLDQLKQIVAKHHRAGGGGHGLADLESLFGHLTWQAVVVQQVIEQMTDAAYQTVPAGVEQLLDRQRVEQGVRRRHSVVEQGEGEMRAGAIVIAHVAFVDPAFDLFLPGQIGLQAAPVERIEAPRRVSETAVVRIGRVQGFAEQHAAQLTAEFQRVLRTVNRIAQAMGGDAAQGRDQVPATQAGDRTLCVDEHGGAGHYARRWFVAHDSTLLRLQAKNKLTEPEHHRRCCGLLPARRPAAHSLRACIKPAAGVNRRAVSDAGASPRADVPPGEIS